MRADVQGGKGIRIGQPDTGYTDHPNLTIVGLDLELDRDVIDNDEMRWTTSSSIRCGPCRFPVTAPRRRA